MEYPQTQLQGIFGDFDQIYTIAPASGLGHQKVVLGNLKNIWKYWKSDNKHD